MDAHLNPHLISQFLQEQPHEWRIFAEELRQLLHSLWICQVRTVGRVVQVVVGLVRVIRVRLLHAKVHILPHLLELLRD